MIKRLSDDEWRTKYASHLRSAGWQATRAKVITRCGNVCEGCGAAPVSQVHHLSYTTYNRSGRELLCELVGLCDACHAAAHGKTASTQDQSGYSCSFCGAEDGSVAILGMGAGNICTTCVDALLVFELLGTVHDKETTARLLEDVRAYALSASLRARA